ncbi:MAG: hypothetical protein Q7S44_00400 [bacterium]|nr:hypothetical protein [bacterium]
MSSELPSVSPAPSDILNLVDHSLKLIGRLRHNFEDGTLLAETPHKWLQPALEEFAEMIKFDQLCVSATVTDITPSRMKSVSYSIPVGITHPGYLWAIMENLHKFNVVGKPIIGMFPQKGSRNLIGLPVDLFQN